MATREEFIEVVEKMAAKLGSETFETPLGLRFGLAPHLEIINPDSDDPVMVLSAGIGDNSMSLTVIVVPYSGMKHVEPDRLESHLLSWISNAFVGTANAIKGNLLLKLEQAMRLAFHDQPVFTHEIGGRERRRPFSEGSYHVFSTGLFRLPLTIRIRHWWVQTSRNYEIWRRERRRHKRRKQ